MSINLTQLIPEMQDAVLAFIAFVMGILVGLLAMGSYTSQDDEEATCELCEADIYDQEEAICYTCDRIICPDCMGGFDECHECEGSY